MRWRFCWRAALVLVLHLAAVGAASEQFDEDLTIRPLRDGKLSARFSLSTLLNNAKPRDPQQLSGDDESVPIPHSCSQPP